MSLHIYSEETLATGLAGWIAGNINLVLRKKDRYSFVLSGGGTPGPLYEILADEFADTVDWQRVDFFWGDERFVPYDDYRNNARMAFEKLLEPLSIPAEHISRMMTDTTAEDAARSYQATLKNYFPADSIYSFDFVLLGMGADAHTLSLFPGQDAGVHGDDWVANVLNEEENLERITLLPSIVNRARCIAFMIKGADKADTLRKVLREPFDPKAYPSQLIKAEKGSVLWFVDESAAASMIR